MKTTINVNKLNVTDNQKNILKKIYSKHNGSYFKISYVTDCNSKVCAAWKGHNVSKITTMSVRAGINYSNIKKVIEKRAAMSEIILSTPKVSWFHHVDDDRVLLKHNTKDNYYIALFPNNGKAQTRWLLDGIEVSKDYLKTNNIMQPSFWKSREGEPSPMITIGLDKIIDVY